MTAYIKTTLHQPPAPGIYWTRSRRLVAEFPHELRRYVFDDRRQAWDGENWEGEAPEEWYQEEGERVRG